mgnify:CR=1 FL=1
MRDRKIKTTACVLLAALLLGGCGEQPIELTEQEEQTIVDYAAHVVSKYNISRYLVRYLSKPNPIILVALPAHLNINGESKITECDLHPALHRVILDRAVGLAIASKGLDTNRTK